MTSNLDPKDLIQAEIDGVATLEESGALNAWAERDSSVRDQLREMRKLADLLADVERVAPPPGLASGVMRAIRASNDSRARTPLARLRALWPSGRTALPFAYAAAAGAAACFLLIRALPGGSPSGSWVGEADVVGTMMAPSGEPIGHKEIAAPGVRGEASLRKAGGSLVIEIDLESPESAAVGLRFDPAEATVLGVAGGPAGLRGLDVADGVVRFSERSGQRVRVLVSPRGTTPASISIELTGEGDLRAQGTLQLPARRD
jgi:hypothetical protein